MSRKIKVPGFAFTAVAAIGMALASSALAGSLHIGTQPAVLTSTSALPEHVMTQTMKNGSTLSSKCQISTFEGTTQGQSVVTDVTVTPTYGKCVMFGLPVNIRMNGCKYTMAGAGQPAFTYLTDIVGCTAGKKMEVEQTYSGCILTIGEQNGLPHITFENTAGPPKDLRMLITLTGIVSTQDAGCSEPGVTAANYALSGITTVTAFKDTGSKQVTLHNHQYLQSTDSEQVDLFST